jgi:hypothetical protein
MDKGLDTSRTFNTKAFCSSMTIAVADLGSVFLGGQICVYKYVI